MARILVLDPDDATRALTRRILVMDHHNVVDVASGDAMLSSLNATPFDAIVVDLDLSDADGGELLELIRLHHAATVTPLIVTTSRPAGELDHRVVRAGVSHVVAKPIRFSDLRAAIHASLSAGTDAVKDLVARGRSSADLYLGWIDLTDQARSDLGPSQPG